MHALPLIACVPKALMPNWPDRATTDSYVVSTCDDCGGEMWLGVNSKAIYEAGGASAKVCMICAIMLRGFRDPNAMMQANPEKKG